MFLFKFIWDSKIEFDLAIRKKKRKFRPQENRYRNYLNLLFYLVKTRETRDFNESIQILFSNEKFFFFFECRGPKSEREKKKKIERTRKEKNSSWFSNYFQSLNLRKRKPKLKNNFIQRGKRFETILPERIKLDEGFPSSILLLFPPLVTRNFK